MKTGVRILWIIWAVSVVVTALAWAFESALAVPILVATVAFFVGAEIMGVYTGNTFSEFVGNEMSHPVLRWTLGVAQAALAMLILNWWIGAALFLWLPAHFVLMRSS